VRQYRIAVVYAGEHKLMGVRPIRPSLQYGTGGIPSACREGDPRRIHDENIIKHFLYRYEFHCPLSFPLEVADCGYEIVRKTRYKYHSRECCTQGNAEHIAVDEVVNLVFHFLCPFLFCPCERACPFPALDESSIAYSTECFKGVNEKKLKKVFEGVPPFDGHRGTGSGQARRIGNDGDDSGGFSPASESAHKEKGAAFAVPSNIKALGV
jgi:hypothetical protein